MVAAPCNPTTNDNAHMNEIRPRLFLGSIHSAIDRASLIERGITHIVSVAEADIGHRQRVRLSSSKDDPCHRLIVAVPDVVSTRLDRHFDACSAFISEGLKEGGVLVHCKAGQSRSPTVVIAHLMREERWATNKALRFVQQRRPSVQPNLGFMEQLRALEVRLGLSDDEDSGSDDDQEVEADEETSPTAESADDSDVVSAIDVQVDVPSDLFGSNETRLRCERLRKRFQGLRSPAAASTILGLAAPLRKRRYQ